MPAINMSIVIPTQLLLCAFLLPNTLLQQSEKERVATINKLLNQWIASDTYPLEVITALRQEPTLSTKLISEYVRKLNLAEESDRAKAEGAIRLLGGLIHESSRTEMSNLYTQWKGSQPEMNSLRIRLIYALNSNTMGSNSHLREAPALSLALLEKWMKAEADVDVLTTALRVYSLNAKTIPPELGKSLIDKVAPKSMGNALRKVNMNALNDYGSVYKEAVAWIGDLLKDPESLVDAEHSLLDSLSLFLLTHLARDQKRLAERASDLEQTAARIEKTLSLLDSQMDALEKQPRTVQVSHKLSRLGLAKLHLSSLRTSLLTLIGKTPSGKDQP